MCFGRKSIYYCVIRIFCKNGKYIIPIICWLKSLPNFECIQIHKDISRLLTLKTNALFEIVIQDSISLCHNFTFFLL